VGNLRRQQESWPGDIARVGVRTTTLSYDSGDRLRQELVVDDSGQKSTDYHYDGVGNRTLKLERTNGALQKQTSYTSNVRNQLTSWEEENGSGIDLRSAALGYDVAGNRTSQALTTHGPVPSTANTSYAWDYDNRLTGVTLPGSLTHSYVYDYRTRRLQRSEPGNNPVAMTFSGGLSVAEFEVIDSQLGTLNSQPSVEYQRGPDMGGGVGGLLYSLRSGTAKFNLSNGRGDVVAQSDASGELTWTASYEAYGKRPVETGSNLDRQRANTKEEDPTGLLNEHYRYRDLETGTWLSRDPAGFVDGPNLYAYVRQNPWSKFDPEGLEAVVTTTGDPDGGKTTTIRFRAVVINATGRTDLNGPIDPTTGKPKWTHDQQMNQIRSNIEKGVQQIFTGQDGNHRFKISTDIRIANSAKDIKAGDHVFRIVEWTSGDLATLSGLAKNGGLNINIQYGVALGDTAGPETAGHETGHSFGLLHPDIDGTTARGKDALNPIKNLDPENFMGYGGKADKVDSRQIDLIQFFHDQGDLNGAHWKNGVWNNTKKTEDETFGSKRFESGVFPEKPKTE
jgi:RHS repeat-associated protein